MKSCKHLIMSDINRHNIPGKGFIRFIKRYSVPGCRYMIYWRLAHKMGGGKISS